MTVPEALEVLGCTTASTKAEVRKAYKALSKRYHTDTKDTADNAKFIRVQKAWAALQAEK
jgi:DnaJ-class molecular chaperone